MTAVDNAAPVALNGCAGLVPAFIQDRVKREVRRAQDVRPFEPVRRLAAWDSWLCRLSRRVPAFVHPATGEVFYLNI